MSLIVLFAIVYRHFSIVFLAEHFFFPCYIKYVTLSVRIYCFIFYNTFSSRFRKVLIFLANDFSQGKVWRNIIAQAVPLTMAQLVQLTYNMVDRIYLGHIEGIGSMALTGIGLTFPVITVITAFALCFGGGGTPIFSIARGAQEEDKARNVMGNSFFLLLSSSVILFALCMLCKRPLLFLFGASEASYIYANAYLRIYLLGTLFSMVTLGMNGYINAQGFPRVGMGTTVIGAVLNMILDPIFIFLFHMGVAGAALATVLSQAVSFLWVMRFLTGKKALLRLEVSRMKPIPSIIRRIITLGTPLFIMQATNGLVQIACTKTLHTFGGDLYVGVMTILNSVRELLSLPINGLSNGALPVLGYNYGARKYDRVRQGIRFQTLLGSGYTAAAWVFVLLAARPLVSLFTSDAEMITAAVPALHLYFFGFVFMALQFAGQISFQSLGCAKRAIFFSIFRKVIIVVPLTLLLPAMGYGVNGVFMAEPISNLIGGTACFLTMYFSLYRKLGK